MRTQELLVLKPRHITEDGAFITIEQALVMENGTAAIGTPKSHDSYRSVPVPEIFGTVLGCCGTPRTSSSGSLPRSLDELVILLISESFPDVRILTPHCCRHTYVSQMQALGADLAAIQSIVGHTDVDMTQHYLHVQAPVRQAAIAKFSDAFSNRQMKPPLDL